MVRAPASFPKLQNRRAHAAGRRVHQPGLVRARMELAVDHPPGGEEHRRQRGGLCHAQVLGLGEHAVDADLEVAGIAVEQGQADDFVAGPKAVHAFADSRHPAGDLEARRDRIAVQFFRRVVKAHADDAVGIVQPAGLIGDHQLARPRLRVRRFDILQSGVAAGFFDYDSMHGTEMRVVNNDQYARIPARGFASTCRTPGGRNLTRLHFATGLGRSCGNGKVQFASKIIADCDHRLRTSNLSGPDDCSRTCSICGGRSR